MWKYVTRRIRDSVERTCNVLESRRTWTCGGAEKNNGPPAGAVDDQSSPSSSSGRCPPDAAVHFESQSLQQHQHGGCAISRPAIRAVVPHQRPYESHGSGSGQRQQYNNDDFHRHDQHFHPHHSSVLGALTWSGAIVAGWYTSQLLCMRHRRRQHLLQYQQAQLQQQWNGNHNYGGAGTAAANAALGAAAEGGGGGGCLYTRALRLQLRRQQQPLSGWLRRSPAVTGQQQQQQQQHDEEWLERLLSAANIKKDAHLDGRNALRQDRDGLLSDDVYRVKHELGKIGFTKNVDDATANPQQLQQQQQPQLADDRDEVDCVQHQSESTVDVTATPLAPKTISDAVHDLLQVIGDIEFQLGVQHMLAERYELAVGHFKLGTSHQHIGATFNLGLCYELGLGIERDAAKALECYVLAAERGHPKALYNVGVFHGQGRGGLHRNRRAAREFFVAAARLGQEDAQRALGLSATDCERLVRANGEDVAASLSTTTSSMALMLVENGWKRTVAENTAPLTSDIFQAAAVMVA